jgi:type I restriction enzyme R subunit
MSGAIHVEARFEDAIEAGLLARGYEAGVAAEFDAERALFPAEVLAYVQASQPKKWQALVGLQGNGAGETLLASLTKELAAKGALHVLRHGFKCFGKTFRLASFAPASGMNPQAWDDYRANRLRVTRQVHFSPRRPELSIDMLLSVNGLPVATLELKNPLSGQNVEHAKCQYERDRDPREPLFQFKQRALVHFAVDPDLVFMTTRLAGKDTFWLPFNRGHDFGAGNPPVPGGYRTGYLWEAVLARDSLLDILGRYLHLQIDEKTVGTDAGPRTVRKETLIFPRYHQLDAVRRLARHAREHGPGRNYLVQHSAGSGKSNSIAWLAHHLASLHDEQDRKLFHSVVIITDRRVLDQQLQNTVYQFEHKRGVVHKIDEDTQQLVRALADGVPIVISTVQKFPFISQALETLAKKGDEVAIDTEGKRYAVIVDEAHSSAAGETAQALRGVLNRAGIEAAVAAQLLDDEDDSELSEEARRALLRDMAKQPRQPNLSYFAFTATPKFKTKALFDEPGPDGAAPFHHYSMHQAIEEGFILDVLANYTTYKSYFGLIKSIEDDPQVPKRKTAKALARFLSLHPHNLSQKVEVIVEHFRAYTRKQIGGRAKAMVVTGSRLHAVRYKQTFDAYCREHSYSDIKSLVAFSGEVVDPDTGARFTESGMNDGLPERQLPERFASDAYQVLLVAEKYQTGFDQPLLHTMYVDKRLAGVQAVQTLSRLNRTAPGKVDTFVLDFVNEREEIFRAFKPYYERTDAGPMPDAHELYRLQHALNEHAVLEPAEIDAFCEIWYARRQTLNDAQHAQLDAIVGAAAERFKGLSEENQEAFKGQLVSFRNLYGFLSQVMPFADEELQRLYVYGRFLLLKLPRRQDGGDYVLEDEVALKYYRLQQIGEGAIDLKGGEAEPLKGPTQVGSFTVREDEPVYLSTLVERLNQQFGTEFTAADQLFFDQVAAAAMESDVLQAAAKVNTLENFQYVFDRLLEELFIERMEGNEEIFDRVMNDREFRRAAASHLVRRVYERMREPSAAT